MGFLGTEANIFSDLTLIFQIIGFISIIIGVIYIKQKTDIVTHDKMTKISVLIGIVALIWMIYSLYLHLEIFALLPIKDIVIFVSHAITGSVALVSGILFVYNKTLLKNKSTMKIVFASWTIALILGIIFYIDYYIVNI